jgi:hypothetical protein
MGVRVSLEEVSNYSFPPKDFLQEFRGFDQKKGFGFGLKCI